MLTRASRKISFWIIQYSPQPQTLFL